MKVSSVKRGIPVDTVRRVLLDESQMEIALIGTMHVSQDSASAVQKLILEELPDTVCVELDESRMRAVATENAPRKGRNGAGLHFEQVLGAFQKKIGDKMNTTPGSDFLQAIESAQMVQARVILIDRDIRTTLERMWKGLGFLGKTRFFFYLIKEMLQARSMKPEEIEKLMEQGEIDVALGELAERFPALKMALVDERDAHMASRIKACGGKKVVVAIGAGHLEGVIRCLQSLQPTSEKV